MTVTNTDQTGACPQEFTDPQESKHSISGSSVRFSNILSALRGRGRAQRIDTRLQRDVPERSRCFIDHGDNPTLDRISFEASYDLF